MWLLHWKNTGHICVMSIEKLSTPVFGIATLYYLGNISNPNPNQHGTQKIGLQMFAVLLSVLLRAILQKEGIKKNNRILDMIC